MSENQNASFNWTKEKLPPLALALGSAGWKLIEALSNVNFILSINNETFFMMFQFFAGYGWWILVVLGVIWFFFVKQHPSKYAIGPEMVIVVGLLSFLFGILVAVKASGSVPKVIVEYGNYGTDNCHATIDTRRLLDFRKKYALALVCGIQDPSIDELTETRITISAQFNITEGGVFITAPHRKEMIDVLKIRENQLVTIWYEAVLIPKDTDMPSIHRLSDVTRYGGKILNEKYFE